MPKPEKGNKHKRPKIDKWLKPKHGWKATTIEEGYSETEEIMLEPETESIAICGKMFDAAGHKLKGMPHVKVRELDTYAVISTSFPVTEDTQVLYKVVADDDADADDDEGVPI